MSRTVAEDAGLLFWHGTEKRKIRTLGSWILDPRDSRKSAMEIASFRSRSKFGGCPRRLLAERAGMLQTVPQAAVMLTTTTKRRNTVLLALNASGTLERHLVEVNFLAVSQIACRE
jgi:hypothetical protein